MLTSLALLSTIAFFDIFDYPLTSFEAWQFLPAPASLLDIEAALKDSPGIEKGEGFFALPGRLAETAQERRKRYIATDAKIKKARRLIRLFSWLPWVRLICLANTIGTHNLRPGGDIDLFIVTKPGRLWLTKLFATAFTQLAGLRPRPGHIADTLCLSFLVDETALNLASFRSADDLYFTYWVAGLVPLYGNPAVYEKLIAANTWLKDALPNWTTACAEPRLRFTLAAKKSDWLAWLAALEKPARRLQEKIMSPTIKQIANLDSRVVISDHVLKLHTVDRREYFKAEHTRRLTRI